MSAISLDTVDIWIWITCSCLGVDDLSLLSGLQAVVLSKNVAKLRLR